MELEGFYESEDSRDVFEKIYVFRHDFFHEVCFLYLSILNFFFLIVLFLVNLLLSHGVSADFSSFSAVESSHEMSPLFFSLLRLQISKILVSTFFSSPLRDLSPSFSDSQFMFLSAHKASLSTPSGPSPIASVHGP